MIQVENVLTLVKIALFD